MIGANEVVKDIPALFKNELILHAVRLPSGDNCQPFKLIFSNNSLSIYHNSKTAKHKLNSDF